jgi:bifunctional non-homologous end joining protein LigD
MAVRFAWNTQLTRRQQWNEVKDFSQAVARHMARLMPERFSAVLGPKNRVKKIFIDYLRNSKGASTVAVFSAAPGPAWAYRCRSRGTN